MDRLKQLSPPTQVVLIGGLLLLIDSFLDWQQVSISGFTAGKNIWDGFGVLAGLLIVALLVWEGLRIAGIKFNLGASVTPGLVSIAIVLVMFLFVLIVFLDRSTARHWPAWIGFILAIVILVAGVIRAKEEGVAIPNLKPSS